MGGSSRNGGVQGLTEVCWSLWYEKLTNFSQNVCLWRVNIL